MKLKHCRNFWDPRPKHIDGNCLLFWPRSMPLRESTSANFPSLCSVCGTQCKQTCKRVRFGATSSFLECVNIAETLKAASLLWVILGVTKLMRGLRVTERELWSVMCRSVTEELIPGRRQLYQVQRFPKFVARGPLLASDNSYGSWYPWWRKYRVFGW